jgi:hypothetical protein
MQGGKLSDTKYIKIKYGRPPDNKWTQQPTKNMRAQPSGYRGRGSTRGEHRGWFDPTMPAAIEVKKMEFIKINQ